MSWIIVGIISIIFLIILSAFFSSSELAIISINRAVIREKARKGDRRAQLLDKLLQNPDTVVSAIVIGNNLVNVLASILAGAISTQIFGNIGLGIATAVMTLLLLVFGEITPKSVGIRNEKFALRVARPVYVITRFFGPFSTGLISLSRFISKNIFGKKDVNPPVTEEEIMAMMRLGEEEGTIKKDERELVNEVFEFDETKVDEVRVPKKEIVYLDENDTIQDLIDKSIETGFSRFPVCKKGNINKIVGMVHIKDALAVKDKNMPVKKIMRDILKVGPGMKADDVLREMQRKKVHIAVVKDRRNKVKGIVTMEDLIEEIFGEIADEHDKNIK
ncbi:MAG: HlyC/CorC family transporter [Thermoplasmata archaeon]|nr:HlyC/CorC family transporter [Thermoplasmata archaeon]